MPTILFIRGWRIYFYPNEGYEPIHVHCRRGDCECKYWLVEESFDLEEEYAYSLSPRDRREIKRIIFEQFDYIVEQWYFEKEIQDGNE